LKRKLFITLLWALVVFILDFATKKLVVGSLEYNEIKEVTGFLNLVYVENQGAAFSLFSGQESWQGIKMTLIATIALIPIIYFFYQAKSSDKLMLSALGLTLGGALGNIHDRLRFNAVIDFLDLHFKANHWPAFNIADVGICVGVALLFFAILRDLKKSEKTPSKKEAKTLKR
jgi:signal peptidase II